MADYPDVEEALLDLLEPFGKTVTVLTKWDAPNLPAIRIDRIGGGDTGAETDEALVRIRCFARPDSTNPRASQAVARKVRDYFKQVNSGDVNAFAANTLIDRADKQSGPVTTPFDDPNVKVTELIYRVIVRD